MEFERRRGFTGQDLGVVDKSRSVAGVGDFNGDGQSDILWRNSNGDTEISNSNGVGGFTSQDLGVVDSSYKIAGVGDFNGDGQSDILWRNAGGDTVLWNSNGAGGFTLQDLGVVSANYKIAGVADFNGDGLSDILWTNKAGGYTDAIDWQSNGAGAFTALDLGVASPGYHVASLGASSGDIFWRSTSGDAFVWQPQHTGGVTGQDLGFVGTSWKMIQNA